MALVGGSVGNFFPDSRWVFCGLHFSYRFVVANEGSEGTASLYCI